MNQNSTQFAPAGTGAIVAEIQRLKRQRNAVLRAHNYQSGAIRNIADFVGDSLSLLQVAARTDADIIVFCGVHFMAETAAILCPDKTVLIPGRVGTLPHNGATPHARRHLGYSDMTAASPAVCACRRIVADPATAGAVSAVAGCDVSNE
jgi:quinolinate synthetase A subunit